MKVASAVTEIINNNEIIRAFDRNMNSTIICPKKKPYCFAKKKHVDFIENLSLPINIKHGSFEDLDKDECVEVSTNLSREIFSRFNPNCLRTLCDESGVPTREADIPRARRWMIDENHEPELEARKLFLDIEVDCRKGLPIPENPKHRIISIAAVNDEGEEMFFCDRSEEWILHQFFTELRKYPEALGFNINKYDKPYLEERAKICGFNYPFRNHQWLDMMDLYKKSEWGLYSSNTLDDIAKRELGMEKTFSIGQIGGAQELWKMFTEAVGGLTSRLRNYNTTDVNILLGLEKKLGLVRAKLEQAAIAGVLVSDSVYVSRIVDTLLMKRYMSRNPRIVANNRQAVKRDKPKFQGGMVLDPVKGLHKNVLEFDFAALYPSVMKLWNIGLETYDPKNGSILTATDAKFVADVDAEAALMLKELAKKREAAKKMRDKYDESSFEWLKWQVRQIGIKTITNSCFGAFGEEGARWYKHEIGETVTANARAVLRESMAITKNLGCDILYADTDSLFVKLPMNLTELQLIGQGKRLANLINKSLKNRLLKKFNIPEHRYVNEKGGYTINFEFADLFTKIFFSGKKKQYIAKSSPSMKAKASIRQMLTSGGFVDAHTTIVGFPMKKYDTMTMLKNIQEKVFKIIFEEESNAAIKAKTKRLLLDELAAMRAGKRDEMLIQQKGCRKSIGSYKNPTLHVRVAKQLEEMGKFRPEDVVKYLVVSDDGRKEAVPVIPGSKLPKISKSGYDYYETRIVDAVERMFVDKFELKNHLLSEFL